MDKNRLIPDNTSGAPPPYSPQALPPQAYGVSQPAAPIMVEQGHVLPPTHTMAIRGPPDYTYYAVIATICFFPLGLLALSYTRRSRESALRGDVRGAYTEAIVARVLSRISMSIGSLILTGIILAIVLPITLSDDD